MNNFFKLYIVVYVYIYINIFIIFSLDSEGNVQSINYNNQMRSQFLNVPLGKVQPLYNALKLFNDISYDDENLINLKLQPGKFIFKYTYFRAQMKIKNNIRKKRRNIILITIIF